MSKRTPMDKEQVRMRRNRLLETAAAAELSLTEAVREMRAIAGMTQEEFARHRGVSARVIKAIETGQANPTVATLNQIGQFFGLEVAFIPIRRQSAVEEQTQPIDVSQRPSSHDSPDAVPMRFNMPSRETIQEIARKALMDAMMQAVEESFRSTMNPSSSSSPAMEKGSGSGKKRQARREPKTEALFVQDSSTQVDAKQVAGDAPPNRKTKNTRAS